MYPPAYQPSIPNENPLYSMSGRRPGGSRQESRDSQRKKEINNYEKMFFNGNSNSNLNDPSIMKKSQS